MQTRLSLEWFLDSSLWSSWELMFACFAFGLLTLVIFIYCHIHIIPAIGILYWDSLCLLSPSPVYCSFLKDVLFILYDLLLAQCLYSCGINIGLLVKLNSVLCFCFRVLFSNLPARWETLIGCIFDTQLIYYRVVSGCQSQKAQLE